MAKNVELLLLETVENLGIVGDIVKVKSGHARNYLLPHGLAEPPSPEKIEALKEARAEAHAELSALRSAREELLGRMEGIAVTIVRSCNDQGVLYGSVTQRDIADALQENGYDVGVRSVRLSQPIRRVGPYEVPVQFDKDLRTEITITIDPDRALDIAMADDVDESAEGAGAEGAEGVEKAEGESGDAKAKADDSA